MHRPAVLGNVVGEGGTARAEVVGPVVHELVDGQLGPPEHFARELRIAAGLGPPAGPPETRESTFARLAPVSSEIKT